MKRRIVPLRLRIASARPRPRTLGRLALAAAIVAGGLTAGAVAAPAAIAAGTTYYIDSATGNDAAAGTSPATAWKSLAAATSRTFAAGDSILLARGGAWSGQLAPKGSGASGAPITISAYGTGAAPSISGAPLATGGAVQLENQSWWTIENLAITNNSGTDNFGATTPGTARAGIQVRNSAGNTTLRGIVIRGNTVSDVNGCFACSGLDAHDNGGIVVDTTAMGANFDGVLIENNHVENVGRTGIVVWDNSYFTTSQTVVVQSALTSNVRVRANTVIDPDSDGILAFGTDGAVLESNVVRGAGQRTFEGSDMPASAGIWPTRGMNTLVQFNEVSGTRLHKTDGQGFDVDMGSTNTRVQYNYSHDNEGGFLLLMGGFSSDVVVRDNLSINDAWGGQKGVITFSWGVPAPVRIYNNTIVIPPGSPAKPIYCDGDAGACASSTPGQWWFTNNIVDNRGTGEYTYPGLGTNAVFSSNLFSGNHPVSEPADAAKITADPGFVAPGTTGDGFGVANAYKLTAGSPAISSGAVQSANGLRDFFGNAVSPTAAPSRGFHEAAPPSPAPALFDPAADWSISTARSANIVIDTTGPLSNMAGDAARFKRSNNAAGWIRWDAAPGKVVTLTTFHFSQPPSAITIVALDASGVETAVPTTATAAVATTNGWTTRTITSGALPAATRAVEVRFGPVSAWGIQVGDVTIN
ncbi:right-handed parallel beta-helix repeat-containing protein [Microbacterium sp. B24]|uniref:right-handed parallel beta-helix repeat-containing protein n=1 Tax=Microbacterium sp. B24 TaxID=95616 RepID=UPI0004285FF7|nr:right-handed parallel beta-helix repeat-containing protein [Microbacterium sp. B24]